MFNNFTLDLFALSALLIAAMTYFRGQQKSLVFIPVKKKNQRPRR